MAAEPFIGQVQAFGFQFNPTGWVPCDGRQLAISEYDALYSLLGTTYGGDGVNTFAVPDLRGRVPLSMGTGQGLSQKIIGEYSGVEAVTLSLSQMPMHTHILSTTGGNFMVSSQAGTTPTPTSTENTIGAANDVNISNTNNAYNNQMPDIALNTGATTSAMVTAAGGSMPFENMEPFLVINYCIAVEGIYPSQS